MTDLDKPLRDATWRAHELSVRMRGRLDSAHGSSTVTVPYDELERLIVLVSFIAGYRMAELDKLKEKS